MATVNVKKTTDSESKSKCKCSANIAEAAKRYREDLEKYYENVPVYTDYSGNIHVNKEYAKEFPEITKTLVEAEIEKAKRVPIQMIKSDDDWTLYDILRKFL